MEGAAPCHRSDPTEVADMLGFGLSKTKMLVLTGEIRSVKIGRNRRILPAWVDEYVRRVTADS
ncbi:excisionase family DNA-binding protein [Streptomyces sp. NPDC051219]|uniref:excisionase family DNA-binding protein n=1 Tax=Streptomyces sp. NPDC051219 TaxID=3155283 RepID=UPI003429135E